MMQHCHMFCWFFLWLLWITCLIPQNSENKPPLTINPHRLSHLLVNAWRVQQVSSFADKAPLSSSMNKPAESENEFVKTRLNEDHIRLFRHRKKVYLSFKKSLVIMEVKMMLLEFQEMMMIHIESDSATNSKWTWHCFAISVKKTRWNFFFFYLHLTLIDALVSPYPDLHK